MKKSYWELLRDPRWQRKRLEVMQAADFACQECGRTDQTLNVHHTYYAKDRSPWEYENASLRCLCEGCHKNTTAQMAEITRLVGQLDPYLMNMVLGFARGITVWASPSGQAGAVIPAFSHEECEGIAAALWIIGHPATHRVSDVADLHDHLLPVDWMIDMRIQCFDAIRLPDPLEGIDTTGFDDFPSEETPG